jgi:isoleucyl-tRNA synthetase
VIYRSAGFILLHITVIVSFPLEESPEVSVLAWTTTPWTLPSNLALCVHPDNMYVKVKGQIQSCWILFLFLITVQSIYIIVFVVPTGWVKIY